MPIAKILEARVPIKIWTDDVAENAEAQLLAVAALPFVYHHVVGLADVHLGIGATVGSVIATKGAICPAAVGVDIGCGMAALNTHIPIAVLDGKLQALRSAIEAAIPVGFSSHSTPLDAAANFYVPRVAPSVASINMLKKSEHQLGTLGGGNHFIEICYDEKGIMWIMLHSGSRGIGNKIASMHIDKAKGVMKQMFIALPDPDLAYFAQGTDDFKAYIADLKWCQEYAAANREIMMGIVRRLVASATGVDVLGDVINCHHNYVAWEHHFGENVMVTRKGAIRARNGDMGIIPGSMGTGSFIVRGLSNAESFDSAPHGAGRRMSRTKARKTFSVEDLVEQTAGVECRKDSSVIDEIPGAYKPIGEVIANSSDLVEVVASLKQVVCIKG
jgi:tRNA-splicing ligase RtcB